MKAQLEKFKREERREKRKKVLREFYFKEMLKSRAVERKFSQEKVCVSLFFIMRENKSRFVS